MQRKVGQHRLHLRRQRARHLQHPAQLLPRYVGPTGIAKIREKDAEYFNLSRRDEAEARAAPPRPAPSITQAKRALSSLPNHNPREMRDKAVFSLLCLTGIRVAALVSLRIRHVDLLEKSVTQDPREVVTKFGKRIDSFFAKGFPEAEGALAAGIGHLDEVEFYGPDDPLFPSTALKSMNTTGFRAEGFVRRPWRTTEPERKIVNGAFEAQAFPRSGRMPSGTCWPVTPRETASQSPNWSPRRRTLGITMC